MLSKLSRTGTLAIESLDSIDICKSLDDIQSLHGHFSLKFLSIFNLIKSNPTNEAIERLPCDLQELLYRVVADPQKAIHADGTWDDIKSINEIINKIQEVTKSCFFNYALEAAEIEYLEKKNDHALVDALDVLEKLPSSCRMIFLNEKNTNRCGRKNNFEFGCNLLQLALLEKEDEMAINILQLLDIRNRKIVILRKNINGSNALDLARENERLTHNMLSLLSEEDRKDVLLGMEK